MQEQAMPFASRCAVLGGAKFRLGFRTLRRALAFTSLALLASAHTAHAQGEVLTAERALFEAVNKERTAQGIPPLQWDEALAAAARLHAQRMAQQNQLSHQLPGEPAVQDRATLAGARFSLIAENIAVAPTPSVIHTAWMQSEHHRENILDPQLNVVGIAVIKSGAGLYAVQDFSQAVANLTFAEQEKRVVASVAGQGMTKVQFSNDARKTCEMERGFSGVHPMSVVRFEASDLSKLPDDLEAKLRSGRYHSAAVGACASGEAVGFTHFRIAVVLY
jgi:uncharacterized protein YkwD